MMVRVAQEAASMQVVRVTDADEAIRRIDAGEAADVFVLEPSLPDPVRVAQRLHTLCPPASIVIAGALPEIAHALEAAPFLGGDVLCHAEGQGGLESVVADAAARGRARRATASARTDPPPLSSQYLGTLLDNAPIGVVTLDENGAVSGWNRRAGELLGEAEVEALGRPFGDLFAEAERERVRGALERLGSGDLRSPGEVVATRTGFVELTGARFAIRDGAEGSIVVVSDVTERERATAALREQRALLEAQSEASEDGILVVGLDGAPRSFNSRFAEMWRLERDAIRPGEPEPALSHVLASVVDPEQYMRGVTVMSEHPDSDFRDELETVDGRILARYGAPVRLADGTVTGRVWFFTDVTRERREAQALAFLAKATEVLSSSLDYETTLRRVAELAVPAMADWCGVDVLDGPALQPVAVAHSDPAKVELVRSMRKRWPAPPDAPAGAARVVRTGDYELYPEIPADAIQAAAQDEDHLAAIRELGLRSIMIVPIRTPDRILGAITFVHAESGRRYGEEDVRLAQELARRAAIAIDNARLHGELAHVARILQESLLPPHLPEVPGLDVAARFRPAGTGVQVGGDFYDLFEAKGGEWGAVIGDVCGKGADAAALTALTRYTARAAGAYEDRASGVLDVLNRALLRRQGELRFTTVAYCRLRLGRAPIELEVAAGGHPRPLVLRADGRVERVAGEGPLIGIVADAAFSDERASLGAGDALVLHTDGVTDARAPARALTEEDLCAELGGCAGLDAAGIADRLVALALGEDEAPPRDDIAILVLKAG